MSDKVAALTVAFGAERFIAANTRQFKEFMPHIVITSEKPWRGDAQPDNTGVIAGQEGATVVSVYEGDDALQRNIGLSILEQHGFEWAVIVDADEFWTELNIFKLLKSMTEEVDVVRAPNMHVYWKTWDYRIYPDPQPDNPVVAMRTNQRFKWSRLVDTERTAETDAEFHHLSYVRTDDEIKQKISSSEHAHEWRNDWYENVWKSWQKTNLHPVIPEQFSNVKINPVPKEIKELFDGS